jgi:tetratricopeptide (TPR) repeat protein
MVNITFAIMLALAPCSSRSAAERAGYLGSIKQKQGDLEGALACYNRAIELCPDMAKAYVARGAIEGKRREFSAALLDFDHAIVLDPNLANAYCGRGDVRQAWHDFDQAIREYDRAIELAEVADAVPYNRRGLAWARKGATDRALADFREAIAISPAAADGYLNRGEIELAKEDFEGADRDAERAIELDRKSARAYAVRGAVESTTGDFQNALTDFDRAIQLDKNYVHAYLARAAISIRNGDLRSADRDVQKAIGLAPDEGASYLTRGTLKKIGGDWTGALSEFKYAARLDPKNAGSYEDIGLCWFQQNDWPNAIAEFNKAFDVTVFADRKDWARLHVWAANVHKPHPEGATRDLANYFVAYRNLDPKSWPRRIIAFVCDKISTAEFLPPVEANSTKLTESQIEWYAFKPLQGGGGANAPPKLIPHRICDAWYYVGLKTLLAGDKVAAFKHFERAVATGEKNDREADFAATELEILRRSPER